MKNSTPSLPPWGAQEVLFTFIYIVVTSASQPVLYCVTVTDVWF